MEISVYKAKCNECPWHIVLIQEDAVRNLSEDHMMIGGHTVDIQEVV